MPQLLLPLALSLLACAPKTGEVETMTGDPLAVRPEPGPQAPFSPPVPTVLTLETADGGLGPELWVIPQPDLPLVSLRLLVPGGSATDPADKAGLTALSDRMLTHGAGELDATEFAALTERLAIDIGSWTAGQWTVVSLDTHAARLDQGLDLLADAVLRPRFDPAEVGRVKELQAGDIKQALDDPRTVATMVARREWFGPEHPLGRPVRGTVSSIEGLTAEQMRQSWQSRAVPGRSVFVVSGAVEPQALKAALEQRFSGWTAPAEPAPLEIPPARGAPDGKLSYYIVDEPGAAQSVLRVMMPGWTSQDPNLPAARLGTIVLGGTFTSRLNRLLREEKGYTYGASAWIEASPAYGIVQASTNVQREVTAEAAVELLRELARFSLGVKAEELQKAAGARRTDVIESMGGRSKIAGTYAELVQQGLGPRSLADEVAMLATLSPEAVNATVTRPNVDQGVLVVVGDYVEVLQKLSSELPGDWKVVPAPQ